VPGDRADRRRLGLHGDHPGTPVPADRLPGARDPCGGHGDLREDLSHRAVLPGRGVHREHRRDRLRAGGGRCVQPSAGPGRCAVRPDRFLHGHLDRPGGRPGDVDAVNAALDPQHRSGVVAVRAHRHRAGLLRPFVTSARRTEAVEYVVVEVELEGGAVGQGSAAETVAVTGEDAESILTTLTGPLTTALTGARGSLTELSALVAGAAPGASSTRAAADVGLHDAWAPAAELALAEVLVGAADLAGLASVREAVATPIMADEAVWTAADAHRIIEAGAADLLNIKLAKTGGIREALAIADTAHDAGLTCMVGAMMEPRISV